MTGKTKHILAFLVVDLLWKRKKEGKATKRRKSNCLQDANHVSNSCV
jgi:hypothetical protein